MHHESLACEQCHRIQASERERVQREDPLEQDKLQKQEALEWEKMLREEAALREEKMRADVLARKELNIAREKAQAEIKAVVGSSIVAPGVAVSTVACTAPSYFVPVATTQLPVKLQAGTMPTPIATFPTQTSVLGSVPPVATTVSVPPVVTTVSVPPVVTTVSAPPVATTSSTVHCLSSKRYCCTSSTNHCSQTAPADETLHQSNFLEIL